jgi:lipid-binding SYLF domain-containing protein
MSVRAGTGVVVARLPDGRWSPPSAIGTGGMGFGGQVGAEVAEFILVLNSRSALTQFMSAGSLTLGGNASVALGPIGRNAEGSGALNSKGKLATMYSYSKTKGAFAGISVEGSAIFERQDCNVKVCFPSVHSIPFSKKIKLSLIADHSSSSLSQAYGRGVTATKILAGHIDIPLWAEDLSNILTARAGSYTEYIDRHPPSESPRNTSFEDDRPAGERRGYENTLFEPRNNDCERDGNREARPPSEPYSFGTSYTCGSSGRAAPKSQNRKSIFTVSSWRLPSRQNSAKTDQSSLGRQGSTTPHWIDNVRSESPPPPENWNAPPLNDGAPTFGSHQSTLIAEQLTEISARNHHDENDDLHSHRGGRKDDDDEVQSLSSIASDDDAPLDSLNDWHDSQPHENTTDLRRRRSESVAKKPFPTRDWYGVIQDDGLVGKPRDLTHPNGMIDDLMSFDHIGPPSPVNYLTRSKSDFPRRTGKNSTSIDDYSQETRDIFGGDMMSKTCNARHLKSSQTGIWAELPKKKTTISAFSSTDKLHCFEGPEGPQAVPELPRDCELEKDFLVGTRMPPVACTNTDLAGYLGKVVAQFDFLGDQAGDLSFKKGDAILIIEKIDDQWLSSFPLSPSISPTSDLLELLHLHHLFSFIPLIFFFFFLFV